MRILAQLTSRQLAFEYESQSPQRQRQNFAPNLNRFFLPAEETHLVSRNRSHSLEARMSQTGEMARREHERNCVSQASERGELASNKRFDSLGLRDSLGVNAGHFDEI